MKTTLKIIIFTILSGCAHYSRDAAYDFNLLISADGTRVYKDSFAGLTPEQANIALSASLGNKGLCGNGWTIKESRVLPENPNITERIIMCK